jgi:hypothetical protein
MSNISPDERERKDRFDRIIGSLHGLPDVMSTKPTTVRAVMPLIGMAQTFIVQTYRQRDGDKTSETVFLEYVDEAGSVRMVIPPAVTKVIARQHEALTTRTKLRGAQAAAETRKALGIKPAFLKK